MIAIGLESFRVNGAVGKDMPFCLILITWRERAGEAIDTVFSAMPSMSMPIYFDSITNSSPHTTDLPYMRRASSTYLCFRLVPSPSCPSSFPMLRNFDIYDSTCALSDWSSDSIAFYGVMRWARHLDFLSCLILSQNHL